MPLKEKKEIKTFYKSTLNGLKDTLKINEGIVYDNSCVLATKASALKEELKSTTNYQLSQNLYDDIYSLLDSIKSVDELKKCNNEIVSLKGRIRTSERTMKLNKDNTLWNTQKHNTQTN